MSQQTDTAIPTRIESLHESMAGHKLRLAGRLLSYDDATALILLLDKNRAVLVDVSLCMESWCSSWVRERLGVLVVIGHLENCLEQLSIPMIPAYTPAPDINPHLVFRALRVIEAADLDLELWNLVIEEKEKSGI